MVFEPDQVDLQLNPPHIGIALTVNWKCLDTAMSQQMTILEGELPHHFQVEMPQISANLEMNCLCAELPLQRKTAASPVLAMSQSLELATSQNLATPRFAMLCPEIAMSQLLAISRRLKTAMLVKLKCLDAAMFHPLAIS